MLIIEASLICLFKDDKNVYWQQRIQVAGFITPKRVIFKTAVN